MPQLIENVTLQVSASSCTGYDLHSDKLVIHGECGHPSYVDTPNGQVGQRPQHFEAASAQVHHNTIPAPPASVVAHAEGALVKAPLAPVAVSGAQVTQLGGAFPALDPQLMGIRTVMEPDVVALAANADASVLVGLARVNDDDTVDVLGVGIVGKTRQTGTITDALYGMYHKIGGLEGRAVIPSGTVARTPDTPVNLNMIWVASSTSWTGTVHEIDPLTGLIATNVSTPTIPDSEENLAILRSFFAEAVPAIIVLDGDGETGDEVVIKEARFIG